MKKNILQESILPCFWLFFFIISSKNEDNVRLKKADDTGLKKQDNISGAGATNGTNKNKEGTFTKAVYLSGY